jgi:hypothetical protein
MAHTIIGETELDNLRKALSEAEARIAVLRAHLDTKCRCVMCNAVRRQKRGRS